MNLRYYRTVAPLALGVVLGVATTANATTFSDEATWRAAAPGFVEEDFEGFGHNTPITSLPSLGVDVSLPSPLAGGTDIAQIAANGIIGGLASSGGLVLSNNDDNAGLPADGPFRFDPTDPSLSFRAVGYWNVGLDDTTVITFHRSDDSVIETIESDPQAVNNLTFVGIVSAEAAAYVTVAPGSEGNSWITVDDLQVLLVPEPASVAVLLFGAAGLLARRR